MPANEDLHANVRSTPIDGDRSYRSIEIRHTDRSDDTRVYLCVTRVLSGGRPYSTEILLTAEQAAELIDGIVSAVNKSTELRMAGL